MFTPEKYEQNCSTTDRLNEIFVPQLVNKMSWNFKKGNILDYGCGPGRTGFNLILPSAVATDSTMLSCDISPEMVEFARQHYNHEKIQYAVGCFGVNSFPFADTQFDKIFSINVFHFVKDINRTLDEIIGVLKPGGQLGFTTCTVNFIMMQCLEELSRSSKWSEYFYGLGEFIPIWSKYNKDEDDPESFFKGIFVDQTGFKDVSLSYKNITHRSTIESAIDINMAMNPALPKVPEEKLGELRMEYKSMITRILDIPSHATEWDFPVEYVYGVLEKPNTE